MSYSFTISDGAVSFNIPAGNLDYSSGLILPGPNTPGYGLYLNQNLAKLLNSFASNTAPQTTNLEGQLWFNKSSQSLNVFTNQGFKPVSGVTNSTTQPGIAKNGDIWFDTTRNQTFLYNEGLFNLVGPTYTKAQGISGAIPVAVQDGFNVGVVRNILKFQYGNTVFATVSGDPSFTPLDAIPGFATINPGITFNSGIAATINSNLVGNVVGNLVGDVTGNITASRLSGTLTGTVIGNLFGDVSGTTLRGTLIGDFSSITGLATNFSSGNVLITGGNVTVTNSTSTRTSTTTLSATTATATNFSSGNVLITGGTASLNTLTATAGTIYNLTSTGVAISGGSATGLLNVGATNGYIQNFSVGNILISASGGGGAIDGVNTMSATVGYFNNFSSSNVIVSGGSVNDTQIGASVAASGRFTVLNATSATLNTLALTTLTGEVDANIGTLSSASTTTASAVSTLQANLGGYQIATNANVGTLTTTVNTINANLGSFQNRTSANIGALTNATIPVGGIILWSGAANAIPTYWRLCDGNNGTPDLRGRFVMGATATTGNVGTRGGTADAVVVSHTHTATVTDPGHAHPNVFGAFGSDLGDQRTTNFSTMNNTTGSATTGISVTNSTAGVSGVGQNLPPFYALCYIMRVS
jgi:hypothetical protein